MNMEKDLRLNIVLSYNRDHRENYKLFITPVRLYEHSIFRFVSNINVIY